MNKVHCSTVHKVNFTAKIMLKRYSYGCGIKFFVFRSALYDMSTFEHFYTMCSNTQVEILVNRKNIFQKYKSITQWNSKNFSTEQSFRDQIYPAEEFSWPNCFYRTVFMAKMVLQDSFNGQKRLTSCSCGLPLFTFL